jgi:Bacillus thuringiensis toxin
MTGFTLISEVSADQRPLVADIEGAFQGAADVREAARGLPGSSLVKIIPGFGLQETTPVSVLVHSLKESVRQALARPFGNPGFWERTEQALAGAFTGLGAQEGAPYLTFHEADGDRTRYTYNLLFALEDEETGGDVYVSAFCLDVTFALGRDRVVALTLEDTAFYAIRLDAITVRVPAPAPVPTATATATAEGASDLPDAERGLAGQHS